MKYFAAVLLSLPLSCLAVDGVYEINQLCVDTGCFNGDAPGWPVTLAQTASYRLTSNLDVTGYDDAGNITVIEITAPNASLDLNGFSIKGSLLFLVPGNGVGIKSLNYGSSIFNGHVIGMPGAGIDCADGCRIEKIFSANNGFIGIQMAVNGLLTDSISINNNFYGVVTNSTVKNCVISGNNGGGMNAGSRSLVTGSQIIANTGNGVQCGGCLLVDNIIANNSSYGVFFTGNSSFGGNLINGNSAGDTNMTMFQTAPNNCSGVACP